MPKFHFEIVDGYTIEDPHGTDLPTEAQAKTLANEIARQIAIDIEDASVTDVVVKTDQGEEIYKTSVRNGE